MTNLINSRFPLVVIAVSALMALLAGQQSSYAAFPGANGKIAFNSNRDGNHEIYVMSPDGSGQTRLTNNPTSDFDAAWSPDGTKIAFNSDRDGNYEIYVMNADGTGQTRLTNNNADDEYPAWWGPR